MLRDAVTITQAIAAPIDIVWRCLTEDRADWWPEMRFEAVSGSALIETWIDEGREASATGSITRCDAPHALSFRWAEEGWKHPLDVAIELVAQGASTLVTLTESGFVRARTSPTLPDEHEEGWRFHLARWKLASEARTS